jgi:hypothetical protein
MKKKIILLFFTSTLVVSSYTTYAQIHRAALTEALENNGKEWIEKQLPPSVITFSDYSGQVEIKTIIASLAAEQEDTSAAMQATANDLADFTMTLDRDQLTGQIAAAKNFTTAGTLTINNTSKKITAQCLLEPGNNPDDGLIISVILRFCPADFNLRMKEEPANEPLIVKVNGGYLNKQQNNF